MEYLEEYNIEKQQIEELKNIYNDAIIKFLIEEKIFIKNTLDYLKDKGKLIYPILENNIKIFLETTVTLKNKYEKMEQNGYSDKMIQMVLINEKLYNEI